MKVSSYWLLSLTLLSGCVAKAEEHPPYCDRPECMASSPTVVNNQGAGGSGATGSGSTNVAGNGATVVTIQGQIVELDETNLGVALGTLSSRNFVVGALGPSGAEFDTAVTSTFALSNVLASKTTWLTAKSATASDLLPGLVAFDATSRNSIIIPVVRSTALLTIASTLVTYTTIDASKAQVVLRFVDANGQAVSGIAVALAGAQRVAYDVGNSYTDDAIGTGSRGLAILFNVDASATPSLLQVSLRGVVTGTIYVTVWQGAATAVDIGVTKG